jgi:hypothetical protein
MAADADPFETDRTIFRTDPLLRAVWREYAEMPGLRLTVRQAQRLWATDERHCAAVLERLVAARLLIRTSDGRYARAIGATSADASSRSPARQTKIAS